MFFLYISILIVIVVYYDYIIFIFLFYCSYLFDIFVSFKNIFIF